MFCEVLSLCFVRFLVCVMCLCALGSLRSPWLPSLAIARFARVARFACRGSPLRGSHQRSIILLIKMMGPPVAQIILPYYQVCLLFTVFQLSFMYFCKRPLDRPSPSSQSICFRTHYLRDSGAQTQHMKRFRGADPRYDVVQTVDITRFRTIAKKMRRGGRIRIHRSRAFSAVNLSRYGHFCDWPLTIYHYSIN